MLIDRYLFLQTASNLFYLWVAVHQEHALGVSSEAARNEGGSPSEELTIIPRARMGSESIAHKAEGRMGYWLRGQEGERNNCFSKIQLVGQKYWDKTTFS